MNKPVVSASNSNKWLIITGGSKGIGKKTIEIFQQHRWNIINISRTNCDLPNVENFNIDLSSSQNISSSALQLKNAVKNASQICLVHNATFYVKDNVSEINPTNFQNTLEVNLLSPNRLNQIFIPCMPARSSIIYIGSTLSTKAVPGSASYTIAKHAIVGFMKATCRDLIKKDIHTCCICPGLVDTDLLQKAVAKNDIPVILENVVENRLIQPEEIAELIHFCAINQTINGTVIHANLGQSV